MAVMKGSTVGPFLLFYVRVFGVQVRFAQGFEAGLGGSLHVGGQPV